MSNLNFLNTNNCNDVSVNTPTKDLTYVDFILKNKIKDFSNIRKYVISYSTNCQDALTTDIPPNYQFKIVSVNCTNSTNINSYTIKLEGIHGDLIDQILYSTAPPLAGTGIGWTNTNGVVTIILNYSDSLNPLPACQFTVYHVDGFVYTILFTLNQSPPTTCSWDGTVAGFSVTYDLPSNIGQPSYGAKFATTGVIAEAIDNVFEIKASNFGTVGNGITISGNNTNTLQELINTYNSANPSNTVSLLYTESPTLPYVPGIGVNFVLSGGTNASNIPSNLQLSLNDLYNVPILYPASYDIKICEQAIIPSGNIVTNGGEFLNAIEPAVTEICFEDSEFIDCQTAECIDSDLCDSTEDICNLTKEVKNQYQSIIYGLDCCDESKQKILKHYIRIVCPSELNC